MKIEMAKMERMAQTGSSLLRLIQNDHTPILDLLIRESVQNSIDAAYEDSDWVGYDIFTVEFKKQRVINYFEGIGEKLNNKFLNKNQKGIVIRDYNTTGLTGPIHQDYVKDNHYGNLLKLIYEISMPQEKVGAGGSWGLGKTVYFRVGIGLVIYYSRIKNNDGTFSSRLAACLVEDETKENRLLPDIGNLRRGIAWWGQQHNENSTKPLTDEKEIHKILRDFNVPKYEGHETGTTVIIPFINEETIIPKREFGLPIWWHISIEHYLNIALQRWYSPKIDNKYYPYGPYLNASVNGKKIKRKEMEPLFSIINTLYTIASTDTWIENDYIDYRSVNVEEIKLYRRTLMNNVAGRVAFTKIHKDSLGMGVPYNKRSPYEYIEIEEPKDSNPPIVLYVRKPGMIISYETQGKWTKGIPNTDKDEYIIAIFVPNSENVVFDSDLNVSLDEYLRQSEKADHSSWNDIILYDKKHTIVERIQKGVTKAVRQVYSDIEKNETLTKSSALSRLLAKELLPPVGFGTAPSGTVKSNVGTKKTMISNKKGKIQIQKMKLDGNNTLILEFYIELPYKVSLVEIDLQIESDGAKRYRGNEWEKDTEVGTPFPVEIIGLSLPNTENSISYEIVKTERFNKNFKLVIYPNYENKIQGKLVILKSDPMIQPSIQERLIKEEFQ